MITGKRSKKVGQGGGRGVGGGSRGGGGGEEQGEEGERGGGGRKGVERERTGRMLVATERKSIRGKKKEERESGRIAKNRGVAVSTP